MIATIDRHRRPSDFQGRAALSLVESLIHALVERSVLTLSEAVEIVSIAAEAELEIAADAGCPPSMPPPSVCALNAIKKSLEQDMR